MTYRALLATKAHFTDERAVEKLSGWRPQPETSHRHERPASGYQRPRLHDWLPWRWPRGENDWLRSYNLLK